MVMEHHNGYYEMDMEISQTTEETYNKVFEMEQRRKAELHSDISVSSVRGAHAVLLVIRADCALQERSRVGLLEDRRLLSEHVWRHTLVLFTSGDWLVNASTDTHISNEGETLQWLVKNCGNHYHVLDNKDRGDTTQVMELLEKIEVIVAQKSCCYYDYYHLALPPKHMKTTVQGQNIQQEVNVELELKDIMTDNRQIMGEEENSNDFGPPNMTGESKPLQSMEVWDAAIE